MTRAWITTSSPNVEGMVNSVNAACERGFVPDEFHFLENPGVVDAVERAIALSTTIVEAYGGEEPDVHTTALDSELAFDRIRTHVRDAIEGVQERGGEAAVDITPGRKYMSAISFAAGFRYGADHVYYFHLQDMAYRGQLYPEIPHTATTLYDFTEEL